MSSVNKLRLVRHVRKNLKLQNLKSCKQRKIGWLWAIVKLLEDEELTVKLSNAGSEPIKSEYMGRRGEGL